MVVRYVNRKGQTYYLHRDVTKTGKPRYYFSMKANGDLAEEIPEGYEIYEHPNGRVYLRKTQPKRIREEEIRLVEQALERNKRLRYYKVDVREKEIVIYEPDQDIEGLKEVFREFSWRGEREVERVIEQMLTYTAMLRFTLVDEKRREFVTERRCFLGEADDWMEIGMSGKLEELVRRYVRRLGTEGFYELF